MNATSGPTLILGPNFGTLDAMKILSVVVWLLFVLWGVYTIIAAYHWLRYGHQSSVAIPALVVHVVVSLALALFALSGFSS